MITEVREIFGGNFAITAVRDGGRASTWTLSRAQLLKLSAQADKALAKQEIAALEAKHKQGVAK